MRRKVATDFRFNVLDHGPLFFRCHRCLRSRQIGIFFALFMLIWAHHIGEELHVIVPEIAHEVFEGWFLFWFLRQNQGVSSISLRIASSSSRAFGQFPQTPRAAIGEQITQIPISNQSGLCGGESGSWMTSALARGRHRTWLGVLRE